MKGVMDYKQLLKLGHFYSAVEAYKEQHLVTFNKAADILSRKRLTKIYCPTHYKPDDRPLVISAAISLLIMVAVVLGIYFTLSRDTVTGPLTPNQIKEYECLARFHRLNPDTDLIYNYPEAPYFYKDKKRIFLRSKQALDYCASKRR